jgi:hypothetical protein
VTTLDKLVRESETAKVALHLLWGLPLVLDWDDLTGTAGHSHVKILAQPVEKNFLVSCSVADPDPHVLGPPGSGSVHQSHRSANPDPPQNVMDSQHWYLSWFLEKKANHSLPQIQTYPQSSISGFLVMHNFIVFLYKTNGS